MVRSAEKVGNYYSKAEKSLREVKERSERYRTRAICRILSMYHICSVLALDEQRRVHPFTLEYSGSFAPVYDMG